MGSLDRPLQNAEVTAGKIASGAVSPDKMSGNQAGGAPAYACRAWVSFDGTGTVAINASGNVSSITDKGVGWYAVNFSSVLQDEKYAAVAMAQRNSAGGTSWCGLYGGTINNQTSDKFEIMNINSVGVAEDAKVFNAAAFR